MSVLDSVTQIRVIPRAKVSFVHVCTHAHAQTHTAGTGQLTSTSDFCRA